jgi:hypothetical protein
MAFLDLDSPYLEVEGVFNQGADPVVNFGIVFKLFNNYLY